MKTPMSLYRSG